MVELPSDDEGLDRLPDDDLLDDMFGAGKEPGGYRGGGLE